MKVQAVAVGLVGLVIAVIFVGLVAVPVVDEATHGTAYEGTNTNNDATFTYVESSPTLSWSRSAAGSVTLTYDGATSTIGAETNDVLLVTDKFALRSNSTGAQLWNYTSNTYSLVTDSTVVVSLTISSGSYSLSFNGDTTTGSVSWALFKDPNGTWGRFTSGFKATVGQTVIMGHLFGSGNGAYNLVEVTNGVVGDYLVSPYTFSGSSIVSQTVEYDVEYSTVGDGQAVGTYTGMTMTYDGSDYDAMRFYAPLDFESTATENTGGINGTLLGIIPVLLIIVSIMIAVRLVRDA